MVYVKDQKFPTVLNKQHGVKQLIFVTLHINIDKVVTSHLLLDAPRVPQGLKTMMSGLLKY